LQPVIDLNKLLPIIAQHPILKEEKIMGSARKPGARVQQNSGRKKAAKIKKKRMEKSRRNSQPSPFG
jgi:hypothetical protein